MLEEYGIINHLDKKIKNVQVAGFGNALDIFQNDGGHFGQGLLGHQITLRQDEHLAPELIGEVDDFERQWP